MILDTGFIIDIMLSDPDAVRKLVSMMGTGESLAITSPTLFELFSGVAQSGRYDQEMAKVRKAIHGMPVLTLDAKSAEKAGLLFGALCKEGKAIDAIDTMIIAIAQSQGEKVLTRNTKHFGRATNIGIETY